MSLPPEAEAQIRAMREAQARQLAMEVEQRREVVRWASVLCTCNAWFRRDDASPAGGCMVHAAAIVTMDGRVF